MGCYSKAYLCFTKTEVLKEATKESFGILIRNRLLDPAPEIMNPNLKGTGPRICILTRFLGNSYAETIWGMLIFYDPKPDPYRILS